MDNGVDREPAVRCYVMGAVREPRAPGNVWRAADDWPPPCAPTPLYLRAGGTLDAAAPAPGDAGETRWTSDPACPMEIPGRAFPGARDARAFERQRDVRTFTSAPLAAPVEWTGRIRAELYVSSTARDTDFIVRVSDVYPDGRSILLVDYPWRARFREGLEREVLMEPYRIYPLAFGVAWISQVFNAGHRIRVTIASTGAPLYEPNPQTGGPMTFDPPAEFAVAVNAVHHDQRHPSRIIAPVAGSGGAAW